MPEDRSAILAARRAAVAATANGTFLLDLKDLACESFWTVLVVQLCADQVVAAAASGSAEEQQLAEDKLGHALKRSNEFEAQWWTLPHSVDVPAELVQLFWRSMFDEMMVCSRRGVVVDGRPFVLAHQAARHLLADLCHCWTLRESMTHNAGCIRSLPRLRPDAVEELVCRARRECARVRRRIHTTRASGPGGATADPDLSEGDWSPPLRKSCLGEWLIRTPHELRQYLKEVASRGAVRSEGSAKSAKSVRLRLDLLTPSDRERIESHLAGGSKILTNVENPHERRNPRMTI